MALIAASLSGQKAHEALDLLMLTIGAKITPSLLISAPKTKISPIGTITDEAFLAGIRQLKDTFNSILSEN